MTRQDGFWFEDMAAGQVLHSPRAITLDRDAIIAFARQYDPQPAHLGEETAKDSLFGLFCASGWQTGSVTMRLIFETLPIVRGGMGAGIEQLRWLRPVLPGDSLRVEITVLAVRPSASRPGSGVVTYRCTTRNQHGEPVQEFTTTVLMPRRPAPA
ncbi:MAG TPA: MaoC family dehydratase [Acetobacteraceae bacterium]|nr:MaoC family dehydratase [Acetobacteraceae bacterium]